MNKPSKFKASSNEMSKVLAEMNAKGDFPISVLTGLEGFSIASASTGEHDPAMQAAVVAMIQKVTAQACSQLGLSLTDEIMLFDKDGRRLICRPFEVNENTLILAVVVPDKNQTYRRLTNQAVSTIRRRWRF